MQFNFRQYRGEGINHEDQTFIGRFKVAPVAKIQAFNYRYTATLGDGNLVHEEAGLIGQNENGQWILVSQMDELPCVVTHGLVNHSAQEWKFAYRGQGTMAGFNSELVFLFSGDEFKLVHRWDMGQPASDKSWCHLIPLD